MEISDLFAFTKIVLYGRFYLLRLIDQNYKLSDYFESINLN